MIPHLVIAFALGALCGAAALIAWIVWWWDRWPSFIPCNPITTMAIKLAPPAFLAAGRITILNEEGEPMTIKFKGLFKRLPKKEREALDQRVNKRVWEAVAEEKRSPFMVAQLNGPLKKVKPMSGDTELLDHVLLGWHLKDLEGNDVAYSKAARDECFEELDGLEAAFINAYYAGRGHQDTPAKN